MSRFKHAFARSLLAAAIVAVPAVPLVAAQPAQASTAASAAQNTVVPDCMGCWVSGGS